jgi:hypothetical protein
MSVPPSLCDKGSVMGRSWDAEDSVLTFFFHVSVVCAAEM